MARIAARLERDMNGGEPQILERAGEHADMVHAMRHRKHPLAVDRAESGLETEGAAKTRRANSRAARMGAERERQHLGADSRGRARGGSTGRAAKIEGVARPRRIAAAEAYGLGLAEDDAAQRTQRRDRRR